MGQILLLSNGKSCFLFNGQIANLEERAASAAHNHTLHFLLRTSSALHSCSAASHAARARGYSAQLCCICISRAWPGADCRVFTETFAFADAYASCYICYCPDSGLTMMDYPSHPATKLFASQVSYSGRRGFSLSTLRPGTKRKDGHEAPRPPSSFMPLPSTSKTRSSWTTHELNALNGRLRSASHDCLMLTDTVSPRPRCSPLLKVTDSGILTAEIILASRPASEKY